MIMYSKQNDPELYNQAIQIVEHLTSESAKFNILSEIMINNKNVFILRHILTTYPEFKFTSYLTSNEALSFLIENNALSFDENDKMNYCNEIVNLFHGVIYSHNFDQFVYLIQKLPISFCNYFTKHYPNTLARSALVLFFYHEIDIFNNSEVKKRYADMLNYLFRNKFITKLDILSEAKYTTFVNFINFMIENLNLVISEDDFSRLMDVKQFYDIYLYLSKKFFYPKEFYSRQLNAFTWPRNSSEVEYYNFLLENGAIPDNFIIPIAVNYFYGKWPVDTKLVKPWLQFSEFRNQFALKFPEFLNTFINSDMMDKIDEYYEICKNSDNLDACWQGYSDDFRHGILIKSIQASNLKYVKFCIQNGKCLEKFDSSNLLQISIDKRNSEIFEYLLSSGHVQPINRPGWLSDEEYVSFLEILFKKALAFWEQGNTKEVARLICACPEIIKFEEFTLFKQFASHGHEALIQFSVSRLSHSHKSKAIGFALSNAATFGYLNIIKMFKSELTGGILEIAAASGNTEIVQYIILYNKYFCNCIKPQMHWKPEIIQWLSDTKNLL